MQVKICCISSIEEAKLAISYGASVLGLVGPMPSGPGTITAKNAGQILQFIPNHINTFYLCSKTTFAGIVEEYEQVLSTHMQLVDNTSIDLRRKLKMRFPNLQIVQVLHVQGEDSINDLESYIVDSDVILLDSGSPEKAVKELGGTGKVHNWEISKRIVELSPIPVFLAGGLNSANIQKAIQLVKPYGVDLCSSVRSNDKLDTLKLDSFFKQIDNLL